MGKESKSGPDLDAIVGLTLDNINKEITEGLADLVEQSVRVEKEISENEIPARREPTMEDRTDILKRLEKSTDKKYLMENDLLGNTDEVVTMDQLKVSNADLWKRIQTSLAGLGGGGTGLLEVRREIDTKVRNAFYDGQYTTNDLQEGSLSLYYTDERVQSVIDSWFPTITTDSVPEGVTNRYFSSSTFDAYFDSAFNANFQETFDNALANDSSVVKEPIYTSKGMIDATTNPAPSPADHGDLYANFVDGFIASGWGAVSGDSILNGNFLIYDSNADSGSEWRKFQGIQGTVLLQEGVDSEQVIAVIADTGKYLAHDGAAISNWQAQGKRISGLAQPVGSNDAATKAYVDANAGGGGGGGPIQPASASVLGGVKVPELEAGQPLRMTNLNYLNVAKARAGTDELNAQRGVAAFAARDFTVDDGYVSLRQSTEIDYRGVAVVAPSQSEAQIGGLYFSNGHLYVRR